jgi:hypothetical protein
MEGKVSGANSLLINSDVVLPDLALFADGSSASTDDQSQQVFNAKSASSTTPPLIVSSVTSSPIAGVTQTHL